ncbi:MAG TPA: zf-HC2 domain-containing protein [Candidatus Ozemobacteraceae bacterium]|nr:zf-HC2 domain-containing protein [Candidatus Ozemobacteraceae bacterium]
MSCEREELLSRYIDGDVTAQESSEIRRHLSACRDCQAAFHEIRQREKSLKDVLQPVIESMRLRDLVMRRIAAEGLRPEPAAAGRQVPPARASRLLAYAVAFMLVVACGLIFHLNVPRGTQDSQQLDMIVVMGLGDQSSFGRKVLARGSTCYGQLGEGFPVRGRMAIFVNGQRIAPVVLDGSATIVLRTAAIDWISGEAVVETPAAPEFTLTVGDDRIRMADATLEITGTAASNAVRLRRGTAFRFRRGGSEPLPLAVPAPPQTPEISTGVVVVASETASDSIHRLAPADETSPVASPAEPSPDAFHSHAQTPASVQSTPREDPEPVISPFGGRPVTKLEGE